MLAEIQWRDNIYPFHQILEQLHQGQFYNYLNINRTTEIMLRTMELQPSDRSYKTTDRDMSLIPPQLYELRSPTQPMLKQQPGTEGGKPWHKQPPDQPQEEEEEEEQQKAEILRPRFSERKRLIRGFPQL
eukprot:1733336-Amphidinium_carterae.3